ncbi:MAG TPA: TIM-barrel domain-containing protein [Acidobacteriaceae bacterium]|nr:TIM-barrel domain-containing protein [Acidobacteriaceae bacterium]
MRLEDNLKPLCGIILSCFLFLSPTGSAAQPKVSIARIASGVEMKTATDSVQLTVCGPASIHVVAAPNSENGDRIDAGTPKTPWIVQACEPGKFTLRMPAALADPRGASPAKNSNVATLDTGKVRVLFSLDSGNIEFQDEQGKRLLQEFPDRPRTYRAVTRNGEPMYAVEDRFYPAVREGIYGLGQHQNGVFNYRGTVVELAQANTDVDVPLLVSSSGYGIFWNSAAVSYYDNRFPSEMRLTANSANAIDYYFFYGPEIDQVVQQYRNLTGHAPLFGEWAYGFFQSKDRYRSDEELLKVAQEYRSQQVPLDGLVQDWFWWVKQGDPEFTADQYPDVPATLKKLHDEHVHAMLSVWGVFNPKSKNFQEMKALGLTIPGTTDYDPTNPKAADFYWTHLVGKLFAQGWDAFWLDSSEPEVAYPHSGQSDASLEDKHLFIGNGARYTNIFPLMHTEGVYRHWRETTDKKRVFILTRSAFAGQQRNAATTWSGDVFSTFESFQRQVPAGLNFALSGMPYWTTDIAGYGPPLARDTHDPAYQELYTRWFEYGVFCPIFRTHGHRANNENEVFSYGPATPTLIRYDNLRYRMLPYLYSLAWQVTHHDSTIMRPLVMDWRTDPQVWNIGDQFMFGPELLVSPVTHKGATSRSMYLPSSPAWYDFWTGIKTKGSQRLEVSAPVDRIPVFVRAGSILPLGPSVQWAGENPGGAIELRIYRGADGDFQLYEDSGDSYDYEKGARAVIPLHWDDGSSTLTVGSRQGGFPGMVQERKIHVVLVDRNHGVGEENTSNPDKTVLYRGVEMSIKNR